MAAGAAVEEGTSGLGGCSSPDTSCGPARRKGPPGVGYFTLLPFSAGSHCSLLNRRGVGLTPAVSSVALPRARHSSAVFTACRPVPALPLPPPPPPRLTPSNLSRSIFFFGAHFETQFNFFLKVKGAKRWQEMEGVNKQQVAIIRPTIAIKRLISEDTMDVKK